MGAYVGDGPRIVVWVSRTGSPWEAPDRLAGGGLGPATTRTATRFPNERLP